MFFILRGDNLLIPWVYISGFQAVKSSFMRCDEKGQNIFDSGFCESSQHLCPIHLTPVKVISRPVITGRMDDAAPPWTIQLGLPLLQSHMETSESAPQTAELWNQPLRRLSPVWTLLVQSLKHLWNLFVLSTSCTKSRDGDCSSVHTQEGAKVRLIKVTFDKNFCRREILKEFTASDNIWPLSWPLSKQTDHIQTFICITTALEQDSNTSWTGNDAAK